MRDPADDEPPDTVPASNVLNQELGRALDRVEARRLEERILTDEELRLAAARKTVVPVGDASTTQPTEAQQIAGPIAGKNLFGGTVRGLPGQPQKLDAEGSAPVSWNGGRSKKEQAPAVDKQGTATPDLVTAEPAPKPRPAAAPALVPTAATPRRRRFLYLGALLVVVPVTILLIARAIDPKPVFSAKPSGAAPGTSSRTTPSATPQLVPADPPSQTVVLPPSVLVPPVGSTAPRPPPSPTRPPAPPPTTLTAVPSTTQPSTIGVEPFFKRTQP